MKIYVYYDQSLDDEGYVCGIHVNLVTEKEAVWAADSAPVTLADALKVPEVRAVVEALRALLIAADGESYADYHAAIETATAALHTIGEGEA